MSETVVSAPPVIDDEGGETVIAPPRVGGMRGRIDELLARARVILADPDKKRIVIAVGAGALLFGILLAIALRGGNKHTAIVAQTGSADGSSTAVAVAPPPPAVVADAAVVAPPVAVDAAVDPAIVIEHPGSAAPVHPTVSTTPHRPAPPSGGGEAQALYKEGVQLFVRGDSAGALAALLKSKAANAGYAPTWRVLGQVYRKLGEKGSAKNAFLRYLTLAPNASDAATVREQLNQL
jgi:hypothetical protein